jgi:hypothetical protein
MSNPKSIALCHHIHSTGKSCGSPALRGEQFCYHHHPTLRPPRHAAARTAFHLPPITDREDFQIAISEVMRRLADNSLDTKRAGLILHCLQMASGTHLT